MTIRFDKLTVEPPTTDCPCGTLTILPEAATVEVGNTFDFLATLTDMDSVIYDVTDQAVWSVTEEATIDGNGRAKGVSAGIATVSCDYCGLNQTALLEVKAVCAGDALDVILVLDRSSTMGTVAHSGWTWLDYARLAAKAFLNGLNFAQDQAAILSYAGVKTPGPPVSASGEATLDHALSGNRESIELALDKLYAVRTPCLFPDEKTGPGNRCARGIGTALVAALLEANSVRHRAGSDVTIVLVVSGPDTVGEPFIFDVVPVILATNANLVIVGIDIPPAYASNLQAVVNASHYIAVDRAEELPGVMASLPVRICLSPYAYENLYD